jgi:multidrug efflux pump
VSLTVTPMICAWFMGRPRPLDEERGHRHLGRRLGQAFDRGFNSVLRGYGRSLNWVLRHRVLMNLVTLATVVFTVWLYIIVPKGFLPNEDTGLLMGQTIAAPAISFNAMETLQRQIVGIIMKDPAVAEVGSRIGVSTGFSSLNRGNLYISLKPMNVRHVSSAEVIARLRPKLAHIAGIQTFLIPQEDLRTGGRQSASDYDFVLSGDNLTELQTWALTLEASRRSLNSRIFPAIRTGPARKWT